MKFALVLFATLACSSSGPAGQADASAPHHDDATPTTGMRQRVACTNGTATLMMTIDPSNPPNVDALVCNTTATTGEVCGKADLLLSILSDRIEVGCSGQQQGFDTAFIFIN